MFGIFLFWLQYVIAAILLYTILRCSYKYKYVEKAGSWNKIQVKSDEKVKFPLWLIILFIMVLFIPIFNLMIFIPFMIIKTGSDVDERIYYKSFLTKEY